MDRVAIADSLAFQATLMKSMTIWQRLNTALALLILLLLVGVGLAILVEKTRSAAELRKMEMRRDNQRVTSSVVQMSDGLRGLLLDPSSESEKLRRRDAEREFSAAINSLQRVFPGNADLLAVTGKLREFVLRTLGSFETRVLDLAETSPGAAAEYYRQNYPAIRKQQDELFSDLTERIQAAIDADKIHALTASAVGLGCLAIVVLGSIFIGRLQSAAIARPLARLGQTLDLMRQGDFTQRLSLERSDEFGTLGDGLNRLADDLSALVGNVQRSGIQVNVTATQIAATAKEQQTTAHEIAATTAQIGATSKEISATSRELVKTMNEVSQVAEQTTHLANSGQAAIARMESTMRHIMEASGSVTAKLAVLSEKTANINSVVTTITKVADQTNLLSLNAAIEAEKAGEYGLGFAVVAMEIRRLADQTAVATYDIEKMVKEMQSAVAAGVMGMDKFSEEVRRGVEEIRQVSTPLAQIIHQVQTLAPRFHTVNEGMHAQATGAQQISETLAQLSDSARQTAESLQQSNLAIDQLNEAARRLQTSVARFKLEH